MTIVRNVVEGSGAVVAQYDFEDDWPHQYLPEGGDRVTITDPSTGSSTEYRVTHRHYDVKLGSSTTVTGVDVFLDV